MKKSDEKRLYKILTQLGVKPRKINPTDRLIEWQLKPLIGKALCFGIIESETAHRFYWQHGIVKNVKSDLKNCSVYIEFTGEHEYGTLYFFFEKDMRISVTKSSRLGTSEKVFLKTIGDDYRPEMKVPKKKSLLEKMQKFSIINTEDWKEIVDENEKGLGLQSVQYATRWASLMEAEIQSGKKLDEEMIGKTSYNADTEKIIGQQHEYAVSILICVWKYGAELRCFERPSDKDILEKQHESLQRNWLN